MILRDKIKHLKSRGIWTSGKKGEGLYKEYYFDGQIYVECNYENGILVGEFKKYKINGELFEHCFYINGIKLVI